MRLINSIHWLWLGVLIICMNARADTLTFQRGGEKLECKLIKKDDKFITVYLNNDEKKRVVFAARDIAEIELDYDSRFRALKKDDWPGHYTLGIWCEEKGNDAPEMLTLAIERYRHCQGQNGVSDEVYLRLGRLLRKRFPLTEEDIQEAYNCFAKYAAVHPDNRETDMALQELGKRLPQPPEKEKKGNDNDDCLLEKRCAWQRVSWGNPGHIAKRADQKNSGAITLEITTMPGSKDKAGFIASLDGDNFTGSRFLSFDAFNAEKSPVQIWFAIISGNRRVWYEQLAKITLRPRQWQSLRVDLRKPAWKALIKDKDIGKAVMPELNPLHNLLILTPPLKQRYRVFVNNMRFEK